MIAHLFHIWRGVWIIFLAFLLALPSISFADNISSGKRERGRFVVEFVTPKKEVYRDIKTVYENNLSFKNIVKSINNEFVFPESVTVKFDVSDSGPMYLPSSNEIIIPYNYIFYLTELYAEHYPDATDDEMLGFSERATTFLFYHETAHALIDIFKLPIVSNEETAADNLAVILALEYNDDGFDIVIDTTYLFDLLDLSNPKKNYQESDYWGEHALDAQRYYNILCLAYGRNPSKVEKLVNSWENKQLKKFIDERGPACQDLYEQQLDAWSQLLEPYFKK
jgi:hypothetical protein